MDNEETTNKTAEDKPDEAAMDVTDDYLGKDAHQNQVTVAPDSGMDVKNGNNGESALTPNDILEVTEEDRKEHDQTSVRDGESEKEMKQVAEDGRERICIETEHSLTASVSLEVSGQLTGLENSVTDAEVGEGVEELTPAQAVQSVRDEQTNDSNLNVQQHDGYAAEANTDRFQELNLPIVSDADAISAGQEEGGRNEEDKETVNTLDDVKDKELNETEDSCSEDSCSDVMNLNVDGGKYAERQDVSNIVHVVNLDSNSHEPDEASLIAQDLVHDLLNKVLWAEGEKAEKNADDGMKESEGTAQFPELQKVDLNSEDWDHDFHTRAAQDNISLSSIENDKDRQPPETDMLGDFEENANGRFDVIETNIKSDRDTDPILSDRDTQLHGSVHQPDTEESCLDQHPPKSFVTDKKRNWMPVETPFHSDTVSSGNVALPSVTTASSTFPAPQMQHAPAQYTCQERMLEHPDNLEESKDGSYLWLQQQIQWRASSKELPKSKTFRETTTAKQDNAENCPRKKMERDSGGGLTEVIDERTRNWSAEASTLLTSPGAIPNFKTLQDQQVSWLSMYRMLEDQHRGELQAQYSEHQRMISDMQRQLEGELLNQQLNVQQKLHLHREALREQTSRTGYTQTQGRRSNSWNILSADTKMDEQVPNKSSSCIMQSTNTMQESLSWRSSQDSQRSRTEIGDRKQLHGGVYSSPMPLGNSKKYEEATGTEIDLRQFNEETARMSNGSEHSQHTSHADQEEQVISPRMRLGLKEKHAKHMADLRSYYEAEILDLRHKLSSLTGGPVQSRFTVGNKETTKDRILQEENQTLRQQLRNLQDALDDAHIYNRELEQKLQGLEIRAADYNERYQESQHNVLKLKNRLEELHSYAQDRESVVEQVQSSERRQAAALQEMQKAQEELMETTLKDKSALKMLLDKHEMLEKDYYTLREAAADFEKKLFETRKETVELNKKISQLEMENKRLDQENSNMCHRLAINGRGPEKQDRADVGNPERKDRVMDRRVTYDEEDCQIDKKFDSPLMRAEHELRHLQQTMGRGEFVPMLQPKKYTLSNSLGSVSDDVIIIDALTSPTKAVNSSRLDGKKKDRKVINSAAFGERGTGGQGITAHTTNPDLCQTGSLSSPTRFDVGIQQTGSRSPASSVKKESDTNREQVGKKDHSSATKSTTKGNSETKQNVDSTLKRIRGGMIVSRPQWEDVYTSLAKPQQPDNKMSSLNMTQEEMLRDRVRSITQIERRYDMLQVEKKNLESQLNKVPSHGRDRKTRREKELLEEKLDSVDRELGSLRMTLKRYQVLKTTI